MSARSHGFLTIPRYAAAVRILLVEDYGPLVRAVRQGLEEAGYAVDAATDGEAGLAYAEATAYDAIVLDVMLPKLDGLAVLQRLRRRGAATPVLVLTARDGVEDRVKGLDLGADDYLVKPFAFAELLARLRALVRRRYGATENVVAVADLEIDTAARRVRRGGAPVELSAREYAVLEYLAARRGQVVSRAEIWDHVYDFASEPSSNVVDVYVGYLRRKIDDGHDVKLIHTKRGRGYLLGEQE
jgi:DNA-binding response OmpR family regulator